MNNPVTEKLKDIEDDACHNIENDWAAYDNNIILIMVDALKRCIKQRDFVIKVLHGDGYTIGDNGDQGIMEILEQIK